MFREPCLVCDVCQARALSNLSRPTNVNLLVVSGFIVYKKYQNMPKFYPLYIFFYPPPYTKKFTPIQKYLPLIHHSKTNLDNTIFLQIPVNISIFGVIGKKSEKLSHKFFSDAFFGIFSFFWTILGQITPIYPF